MGRTPPAPRARTERRRRLDLLHYATYFDRHYLPRGLVLHRSLARHSPPFVLWVLCLDDETYRTLATLRPDGVKLIRLAELERSDPALLRVKPERRTVEYYWTCGPAFLVHLLERQPAIARLTYLDADLCFFDDPTLIHDGVRDGSILLVEHRATSPRSGRPVGKGRYNVGMLSFPRTSEGVACLARWREQCLDWCFDRVEADRFGDQKYLEAWPARYRGVVVVQHKGAGVAPWNVARYRIRYAQGRIRVGSAPLVFYHFSGLRMVTAWLYEPCRLWRRRDLNPIVRRHVYVPYVRELRAAATRVRAAGGRVYGLESLRHGEHALRRVAHVALRRNFLIVTDRFALWG